MSPGIRWLGGAVGIAILSCAGCGGSSGPSIEAQVAAQLSKRHPNVSDVQCVHDGGDSYTCHARVRGNVATFHIRATSANDGSGLSLGQ